MSELLKRFEETNKPRPAEARNIPALVTDMFDTTLQYAKGFSTFKKKGEPTEFTKTAIEYYNTEHKEIVIPENFVPTEQGITLSRWTPDNQYYTTGKGK